MNWSGTSLSLLSLALDVGSLLVLRVGLPLHKFEARVRGIGLLLLHGVSFALSRVVRDVFVVAELALGQGDGILEVSQGAAGLRE